MHRLTSDLRQEMKELKIDKEKLTQIQEIEIQIQQTEYSKLITRTDVAIGLVAL